MDNVIGIVVIILNLILIVLLLFRGFCKMNRNFGSVKRVQATLVNKQSYVEERFVAGIPSYNRKYVLTFLCKGKKRYFDVSSETYDRLKLKQQGILEYRGARFFDFR